MTEQAIATIPFAIPPLVDVQTEREITQLLYIEAELLDQTRYQEWYDTVFAEDLEYIAPTRSTRERKPGGSEYHVESYHFRDLHSTLALRVNRMYTGHAWAEDPASRTRRLVTNIRIEDRGDGKFLVKSYLLLYRSQWGTSSYDLIVAERYDTLSKASGQWRISRREVYLTHTVLGTPNLGVFL